MNNINILVVEDDLEINKLINEHLSKQGYTVESVYDGEIAIDKINKEEYKLIILDLMLPKVDGEEVLRRAREKANIPIIILSAKDSQFDKILGLGLGADDYMTKPFTLEELLARVKAQLRRYIYFSVDAKKEEEKVIVSGNLELNLETYELKKGNTIIAFTAKEFELLKLFMTNPNRVFTKAQLFNLVWGEEFIGDENTVMVHIRRLRTKIEEDSSNPVYIQTVWGIGYKFGEIK